MKNEQKELNPKTKYRFKNKFVNFLVIFTTVFTLMLATYVSISLFVYQQFNLHFFYIIAIILMSMVVSVVLSLFVKINNISLSAQVSVVYSVFVLACLALALICNLLNFINIKFLLITTICSFIGLGVSLLVLLFSKKKEEDTLNSDLADFKGRKRL